MKTNNVNKIVNRSPEKVSIDNSESKEFTSKPEYIKIVDSIDDMILNLFHKHSSVKLKNLKDLHHRFQNNYLNVTDDCKWTERLVDISKNLIYNRNIQVQFNTIKLFSSFLIQIANLSHSKYNDIITKLLKPFINDSTVDVNARCAAIESITASMFFIKSPDSLKIAKIMNLLENIFTVPSTEKYYIKLEINAIRCWSLLYTILPEHMLHNFGSRILCLSSDLLDRNSVDVRIRVGECLALIFERMRNEIDPEFVCDNYESLIEKIKCLSVDYCKDKNKIDLAKQRHEFRLIIQSIESYSSKFTDFNMQFELEILSITNWTRKIHYNFIQKILQDGFLIQFRRNNVIREIFDLELPLRNDQIRLLRKKLSKTVRRKQNKLIERKIKRNHR